MNNKSRICDMLENVIEMTKECGDIFFIIYNEATKNIELAFSQDDIYFIPVGKSDIDMVYDIVKICMNHAVAKGKIGL